MAVSDKYVEKTRTWNDNWNNVIRNVIYPDEKLRELMLIPEGTDILKFTDKYFIRDGSTDELLTNEKVRIVCRDEKMSRGLGSRKVTGHFKSFDIFVNEDVEHTATEDRLQNRQVLIAERLKYLLLRQYNCQNLHFDFEDEYDQWTKTVGYKLYRLTFFYITTV